MSRPPTFRHPGAPKNPGVRDLVDGKKRWSSSQKTSNLKKGFRGWHERGYLPHRDEPGLTQFVTFRLVDSFPESLRAELEHLWLIEDERSQRIELEAYLDGGRGACQLGKPEIAKLVEDNFLNFAKNHSSPKPGQNVGRYQLRAWCLMPNHVHVLFKVENASMSETVGAWKKHTGRLANRLQGTAGAFWAEDYFDTFMRDAEHELTTVHYIENNPVKARLVLDPKEWLWSSARFRDAFGVLNLPV